MTTKTSAGILLWALGQDEILRVFIAHMGGPFWERKDSGAWSVPKGEYEEPDSPLEAAKREFVEEIGVPLPSVELERLGEFKQSSGKVITVFFGRCADVSLSFVSSNTFELEWPRGSGQLKEFKEIDRAEWFPVDIAKTKVTKGQVAVIEALEKELRSSEFFFLTAEVELDTLF